MKKSEGSKLKKLIVFAVAVFITLAWIQPSLSAFPEKSIQIIVPWPPGGRIDVISRIFASHASKYLEEPVVVVNKAGGGGIPGATFVVNSKPDGYTLIGIAPGTNVFPPIFSKPPYGPYDFDAIGQIASSTQVVAVGASRPWKSMNELMDAAKQNPGQLTYSTLAKKLQHLSFLRFEDAAGLKFKFVPAANDAKAIWNVLGGHVDIVISSSMSAIITHFKDKKLMPLMVFNAKRDHRLPSTPTAKELGYDVVASPYSGIAGPKGIDKEALEKLRDVFKKVVSDPDFIKAMEKVGESVDPIVGDDFYQVWKSFYEGYLRISKKMGFIK